MSANRKKNQSGNMPGTNSPKKRHSVNINEFASRPMKSDKIVRFNVADSFSGQSRRSKKLGSLSVPFLNKTAAMKVRETVAALQKLQLKDSASTTPYAIPRIEVSKPNQIKQKTENEVNNVKRLKKEQNYVKEKVVVLSKGSKEDKIKIGEEVLTTNKKTTPLDILPRYSLPVHIGNWYDNLCLFDSKVEAIDAKFAQGLNFEQQKEMVLRYLYEPVDLSAQSTHLVYNSAIHIASYMEYSIPNEHVLEPPGKLVLSTLVTEDQIIYGGRFCIESGSQVTLSNDLRHLRRNVFTFISCNTIEKSEPNFINYHENVYIRLFSRNTNVPLYLRCEIPNTDYFGENKDRFLLRLTDTLDHYCKFQIQSLNHLKRMWKVRESAPAFEKVLICHTMSNRLLAVDQHLANDSLIVGREIKACCFKYKVNFDVIPPETLWSIRTQEDVKMS